MSLAEYLAKNYLTKDDSSSSISKSGKKAKKRKRKDKGDFGGGGGIIIADDDALGWEGDEKKGEEGGKDGPLLGQDEVRREGSLELIANL